jgi:hypothetical protein
MCGHAGFARKPGSKGFGAAKQAFTEMMLGIESRGRHATGLAVMGGKHDFLWKIAQPISALHKDGNWKTQVGRIDKSAAAVIGHTRWATLPNAHEDAAAHPFRIGRTVLAHNGIIRNWTTLRTEFPSEDTGDWIVDSQAAAYMLDRFDDPKKAIAKLAGDWVLVWMKDGKLSMARNDGRNVFCAYVARWRTMFWCSERDVLTKALRNAGVTKAEIEVWSPLVDAIYQYDVAAFNGETNGVRTMLPKRSKVRPVKQENFFPDWVRDAQDGRMLPARTIERAPAGTPSIARLLGKLEQRIEELEGIVEGQQAEIKLLLDTIAEAGLLDEPKF